MRSPPHIESGPNRRGCKKDTSAKHLTNDDYHLFSLVAYVMVLTAVDIISLFFSEGLEVSEDFLWGVIVLVLSAVCVGHALFRLISIRQWIRTLFVISFSSFFDGITMIDHYYHLWISKDVYLVWNDDP